jgi:uncharacterized RDD family membrane protein YckC
MRCPKCHYVSFDGQSRCRNCGYDFSLAQPAAADPVDLPTRTDATATALADLSLKIEPPATATDTPALVDRYMPAQPSPPAAATAASRAGAARAPARGGPAGSSDASSVNRGGNASATDSFGSDPDTEPLDLPLFSPPEPDTASIRNASVSGMGAAGAGSGLGSRAASPAFPPAPPAPASRAPVDASPASTASTASMPSATSAASRMAAQASPVSQASGATGAGTPTSATAPMQVPGPRSPGDDRPMVSGATPPRAPLSVRRPTGDVPRPRPRVTPQPSSARSEEPRLDLGSPEPAIEPDLDDLDRRMATQPRDIAASIAASRAAASRSLITRDPAARDAAARNAQAADTLNAGARGADGDAAAVDGDLAPLGTRALAGAIDVAFMIAVAAVVLYFTLRITVLPLSEWRRLPVAPLAGFLGLIYGGYLTMFTAASGQTMGKMLMGVRVVTSHGDPVPFGSAVLRAAVWLLTIVPAGVGFIPALLAADRRALHDRFAETKVITTTD